METTTVPAATTEQDYPKGVAPVKKEFIIQIENKEYDQDEDSDSDKEETSSRKRKNARGQNKDRDKKMKAQRIPDSEKLCPNLSVGEECKFKESCKYNHNIKKFLEEKKPDVLDECPIFKVCGKCPYGLKCRAGESHSIDGAQIVNQELVDKAAVTVFNGINKEIRDGIRSKQIPFTKTKEAKKFLDAKKKSSAASNQNTTGEPQKEEISAKAVETQSDYDFSETREKKKIDFNGKTYLAPLTTVGNLPFRRICKEFGVDITCSEMAMCSNLLQGYSTEWALTKRHSSEDIFGIQICGNSFDQIVQTTELLNDYCKVDFIDLNVGCPIDNVFDKGSGSGMLKSKNRMFNIIEGMSMVSKAPITVKYRTGINKKEQIALDLTLKLENIGIQLGTLHGRSRMQRYSKLADWDYIKTVKNASSQINVLGNGDIYSWEDYWRKLEDTKVDGIMIGRGALIKPWIFQEINERKVWDISSRERFDILKKYCSYGLEHWGTDDMGLHHTRRYLCEWQSFLHRYVPAGLLEVLPSKINERPPKYYGRDDLETLMASPNVADWIKISEMLLGPAPEDFSFVPKHKSNSYEG